MAAVVQQPALVGLSGYLGRSTGPSTFAVPTAALRARLPVRPGEAVPGGLRPIPTSSQRPKQSNVQVPYARLCGTHTDKATGMHVPPVEGDIVLVEREAVLRAPMSMMVAGAFAYVRTIERLNVELAEPREAPDDASPAAYTYETFPYRVDGVVNSIDGVDLGNEYRDHTLAVVAIQGPVRLDHSEERRCCFRKTLAGTTVYVGLETKPYAPNATTKRARAVHRLVRFSGAQITKGAYDFGAADGYSLVCAWRVGVLLDSNQVRSMHGVALTDGAMARSLVSVAVDLAVVRDIGPKDAEPYQIYTDEDGNEQRVWEVLNDQPEWARRGREEIKLKTKSAKAQLRSRWMTRETADAEKAAADKAAAADPKDGAKAAAAADAADAAAA